MPNAVKLTPEAKKIVKQAIENIKAHPDQFDMSHWIGKNASPKELRTCGTSACLAGHIALAALGKVQHQKGVISGSGFLSDIFVKQSTVRKKLKQFADRIPEREVYLDAVTPIPVMKVSDIAAVILGGRDEADLMVLFDAYAWPEPYGSKFRILASKEDSETVLRQRANLAVARLKHFLKTGE